MKSTTALIPLALLLLLASCSLKDIKEQTNVIEEASTVTGEIFNKSQESGDVYLKIYKKHDEEVELANQYLVEGNTYKTTLIPGVYMFSAFVDVNGNEQFDLGEPSAYISDDKYQIRMIDVREKKINSIETIFIKDAVHSYADEARKNVAKSTQNIGRVISLDDPMFDNDIQMAGFWRPIDFLQDVGGGLMMLQEYQADKTPVLFVHGIMGDPNDLAPLINSLDTEKYQAWVLYYPSGIRLDMISDYMIRALNKLDKKYDFNSLILVAHSMGGLMSRSYVEKYSLSEQSYDLKQFITINSPLYGMDSAATGVKRSPIVVPSWRDVASNSDYIKRVHQWTLPEEIDYRLIFSYLEDETGDGIVPITSQLSLSLQDEADGIYGFEGQHVYVMQNPEFIRRFHQMLQ